MYHNRLLSLLLFLSLLFQTFAAVPITILENNRTESRYVIENQLPVAEQTHEVIQVPNSNTILISQMSNSVLLKADVDSRGVVNAIGAFRIGSMTSGLHGLVLSKCYPGKVWLTLQKDNKLLLIDPLVLSTLSKPKILIEIDVPAPGLGPHYIGEYGDEVWSTLQDSSHVLRINFKDPSDYTLYRGIPRPIFIAQHPKNKMFYSGEDNSASVMKIDPVTAATSQLPIPASVGQTPVGLIAGPKGIWFTLLGNSTHGTGTIGFIPKNDKIVYHKLTSPLGSKASLLHLAFDPKSDENHSVWLLASSIINSNALDMIIKVTFDTKWKNIVSEDIVVTPTQLNKAHRLLVRETNVFATELASSKLMSYYTH